MQSTLSNSQSKGNKYWKSLPIFYFKTFLRLFTLWLERILLLHHLHHLINHCAELVCLQFTACDVCVPFTHISSSACIQQQTLPGLISIYKFEPHQLASAANLKHTASCVLQVKNTAKKKMMSISCPIKMQMSASARKNGDDDDDAHHRLFSL